VRQGWRVGRLSAVWIAVFLWQFFTVLGDAWSGPPCADLGRQEKTAYNNQVMAAVQAAEGEDFGQAVKALAGAYEICAEDPKITLRLAQWHLAMGDCAASLRWYQVVAEQAEEGPFSDLVADAKRQAASDAAKVEAQCVGQGRVTVQCQGAPMRLFLDDRALGTCPAETYLPPGSYDLLVQPEGFAPYVKRIEVVAGENLFAVGPRGDAGDDAADPAPPPVGAPGASASRGGTSLGAILGWSLLGIGLGLEGAGIGMTLWASSASDEATKYAQATADLDEAERLRRYQEASDAHDQRRMLSYIFYGVGSAVLVGGVVLLVLDALDTDGDAGHACLPLLDVREDRASLHLRFVF